MDRQKGLYPAKQVWWELVEVPRGMAARVIYMVALKVSKLIGERVPAVFGKGPPQGLLLVTQVGQSL